MRICVVHLNQIGDLAFSLPLLKSLRDGYPGAKIHSVLKPGIGKLLEGWDVDNVFQIVPMEERIFNSKLLCF